MVRALGHVVVATAVSADEAIRVAEHEKPHVALVDIRLVGVRDGIDAGEELLTCRAYWLPPILTLRRVLELNPLTRWAF